MRGTFHLAPIDHCIDTRHKEPQLTVSNPIGYKITDLFLVNSFFTNPRLHVDTLPHTFVFAQKHLSSPTSTQRKHLSAISTSRKLKRHLHSAPRFCLERISQQTTAALIAIGSSSKVAAYRDLATYSRTAKVPMSKNSQAVNPNGKAFEATGQPLSPQLSEDLKQISMEAFSEEDSYQDTWSQYPSYQTGSQPLTVDSNQHAFSTNIQQASRYQSDSVPESTYSPQTHGARRSWREEPSISPMNYNQGALQNHVSPISPMTPGFPLVPDSTGRQLVFEDNVQSTCTPAHGMPQHYEGSLGLPPQTPPRDIYGSFGSAPNSCTYTPFQSPDSEFLVQSPRLIQEQHISALNHGQQENLRKSAVGPIR